ncbi:MAG: hypothetical protein ACKOBL_12050 [Chloroflexota bacterium]
MVSGSPKKSQVPVENTSHSEQLEMLTLQQIIMIDNLLKSLGQFGEVHLIVSHGELRFINKVESYKFQRTNIDSRLGDLSSANDT